MKKNFVWMLAAVLTCGLAMATLTACNNSDNPVAPKPDVQKSLAGDWFTTIKMEEGYVNELVHVMISFDEDGVYTHKVYYLYPDEPADYSERFFRHGIYSVDEAAGTMLFARGEVEDNENLSYQLNRYSLKLQLYL
jgi:hypothetical protein